MAEQERIEVKTATVDCDGGGGALGHPAVYLKIGAAGAVICPYCSRHFVLSKDAAAEAGH
ncbi:MAG TPA: zinc-finger domain-containing protein [Rhodospirillales bacterium]|jgi:uncharacterized Zn-finger protein|nr:zinc-finger domain-containing protein [Rhodospirillales bacterium]